LDPRVRPNEEGKICFNGGGNSSKKGQHAEKGRQKPLSKVGGGDEKDMLVLKVGKKQEHKVSNPLMFFEENPHENKPGDP